MRWIIRAPGPHARAKRESGPKKKPDPVNAMHRHAWAKRSAKSVAQSLRDVIQFSLCVPRHIPLHTCVGRGIWVDLFCLARIFGPQTTGIVGVHMNSAAGARVQSCHLSYAHWSIW